MENTRINIDTQQVAPDGEVSDVSRIKRLHPTLRKCRCGFIGSKYQVMTHITGGLRVRASLDPTRQAENVKSFWLHHGEVPLNEDEGNEFQNAKWLEGTPKGYNE